MTETAEATTAPTTFAEAQDVLAGSLPGYTRRAHQMALAEITEAVIRDSRHGLFQAGTGTGKSLVALITAILSGQRTIIATATKALQNQYARKDLPFLEQYLGVPFTWAVIKGRANYPCHAQAEVIQDPSPRQAEVIARVEELSTPDAVRDLEVTDREDFPDLTEEEWRPFSISADECPGKDNCPFGNVCIAERAKAKAGQSDIVITNTAYLLRDLSLRDQSAGNVQLLGHMDRVVVDEAHTLPDVARSALEDMLGEGQLVKLARDMAAYMKREDLDYQLAQRIEPAAAGLWRQVTTAYADWMEVKSKGKYDPMPLAHDDLMGDAYGSYFIDLYQSIDAARTEINSQRAYEDRQKLARTRLLRRSLKVLARIEAFTTDSEDKTVRWAQMQESTFRGETRRRVFLYSSPVQVGDFLRKVLWDSVPTTLISATLAAGNDFSFMKRTVGLREPKGDEPPEAEVYDAGTPFDYKTQAMLFVPAKGKPEPTPQNKATWRGYMQGATKYLVTAAGGGALLLYTSRAEMNTAYEALADDFREQGLHVMRQGDTTTSKLIEMMKADGNAVLFALRTFFEGIDIQGDALRLVVIDKLPFAVPTDLVHQARENALIRERGDKWAGFEYLTIPEMILVLTQGLGRLIRHADDRGVMAVLDPRLMSKGYGTKIMRKLPPATVTTDPARAADFLRRSR
jgi:ATP-dependent DNA helicase DinG